VKKRATTGDDHGQYHRTPGRPVRRAHEERDPLADSSRPSRWRTRRPLSLSAWVCIVVVYPVAVLMFRVRARRGQIPVRGPVLLVANHVSILDPIACGLMVFKAGRFPHFLAKESVFKGFAGVLLRGAGQIPVKRYTKDAHDALEAARADLAAGNIVVIYPEGSVTRDPGWWPMQPSTGAARLALTTDAVVVPVAQWGPQEVHDYHRKQLRLRFRARADYLIGEPIDLEAQRDLLRAGRPLTAELLRETSDLMMSRVRDQLAELRNEPAPSSFAPRPVTGAGGSVSGSAA
jgi:1-acyl-sn-glycerol-3-phosphate acyltransferase